MEKISGRSILKGLAITALALAVTGLGGKAAAEGLSSFIRAANEDAVQRHKPSPENKQKGMNDLGSH
jgi:hypothetical protein